MFFDRFHFVDPGPLVDGDLELVMPDLGLLDELMISITDPLTRMLAPAEAQITREQLLEFLQNAPFGQEPANTSYGRVPQYHFWMRLRDGWWGRDRCPKIRIVGGISLRVGWTPSVELYYGHVGYHVYPAARGRRYAERACRLLLPLARRHKFRTMWITCNPDNFASRRTVERLGGKLVEIVPVPETEPLFDRGEFEKCRYRLDVKKMVAMMPVSKA